MTTAHTLRNRRRANKLLRDANTNRMVAESQRAQGCPNIAELYERTAALYEFQARAALAAAKQS